MYEFGNQPYNFTKDEVIDSFEKANGVVSHAARLLGCSRVHIYALLKQHPTWRQELERIREEVVEYTIDLAENTLIYAMNNVAKDPSNAIKAAMFYLNNKAGSRGYAHPLKVDNRVGAMVDNVDEQIKVVYEEKRPWWKLEFKAVEEERERKEKEREALLVQSQDSELP